MHVPIERGKSSEAESCARYSICGTVQALLRKVKSADRTIKRASMMHMMFQTYRRLAVPAARARSEFPQNRIDQQSADKLDAANELSTYCTSISELIAVGSFQQTIIMDLSVTNL